LALAPGEVSVLAPALAPVDSRVVLPAEAPETSELEWVPPVRLEGKLLELVMGGAGWPVGELAGGELPPPAADGALWAKAPVAAPAARAATAQRVVIVRIWKCSLRTASTRQLTAVRWSVRRCREVAAATACAATTADGH
jgi:hypothetical protein